MSLLRAPHKAKEEKLHDYSSTQRRALEEIEREAIASYKGSLEELESALGMLRMGHHFGWKVLYILHSKATIRKYEAILTGEAKSPVRVRELFPPTGPSSYRSNGFRIIEAASNFWKAISGEASDVAIDKSKRRLVD